VTTTELRVPFATLLKIALTILLVLIVMKLWPVILMLVIAVLIAVMLDPIVVWLEEHRVRRGIGISLIAVIMLALLALFFGGLIPAISRQIAEVARQAPQLLEKFSARFPGVAALIRQPNPQQVPRLFGRGLIAGMYAIEGVTAMLFVLVVAIYLLVEGRRAFEWLVSFAPQHNRKKFDRTAHDMRPVVLAYMRGNVITSCICAGYVFVVLTVLHIPMPLLLATIAFIADFVPVVGTIVMTLPAALFALLTSPVRAVLVVVAYLFYHLVENYVIIPRAYGTQMRLSTLTVLVAIAIGGTLQGVIGALLALPIAAAYPIVERIWLREHLPADTVAKHERIEERG
jgi:predicted PurR-regulated permease PerM